MTSGGKWIPFFYILFLYLYLFKPLLSYACILLVRCIRSLPSFAF
jgi:hypothetical protein